LDQEVIVAEPMHKAEIHPALAEALRADRGAFNHGKVDILILE
jgi:hypothetical protein